MDALIGTGMGYFNVRNDNPYNTEFVTLTFKDKIRHSKEWKDLFLKTFVPLADKLNKCGQFQLVSELDKNGNFHYHYMIQIKDHIKHSIHLNHWMTKCGFKKRIDVTNKLGCFIYIRKQSKEMADQILDKFGIENYGIFTNSTYGKMAEALFVYTTQKPKLKTVQRQIKGPLERYYKLTSSRQL